MPVPTCRGRIFIAADLESERAIRADTALPGFESSVKPVLAVDKVRHVGDPVAVCVALTRIEAEDMAAKREIDFEPLPQVGQSERAHLVSNEPRARRARSRLADLTGRVMHYLRPTDTATQVVTSTIIVAPAIEPIFGISENTKKATIAEMTKI